MQTRCPWNHTLMHVFLFSFLNPTYMDAWGYSVMAYAHTYIHTYIHAHTHTGIQCLELQRDGTCAIDPTEPVGFLWVSLKAYLPSRAQCASAKKGPPILSPFTKYNKIPIPTPEQLKCTARFGLRLHIFQVRYVCVCVCTY